MMELMYDETIDAWVEKPAAYASIEIATEEDYKALQDAVDLYQGMHELGTYNLEGDARELLTWVSAVNRLIEQYTAVPSKRESEDDG